MRIKSWPWERRFKSYRAFIFRRLCEARTLRDQASAGTTERYYWGGIALALAEAINELDSRVLHDDETYLFVEGSK